MKKALYALVLFTLLIQPKLFTQEDFFTTVGLPSSYFAATDVAQRQNEGAWAIASTSSFDEYEQDIILYKIGLAGQIEDSIRYFQPGTQESASLGLFSDNSILITGINNRDYETMRDDVLLKKVDPQGVELWSKNIGDVYQDQPLLATVTGADNILLLSQERTTGWFDRVITDYLTKLDSDGNVLWQMVVNFDNLGLDVINAIIPFAGDQVLVLGSVTDEDDITRATMIRMDGNGDAIWTSQSVSTFPSGNMSAYRFPHAWVDHDNEKILISGQDPDVRNWLFFIFDFAGNQITDFWQNDFEDARSSRLPFYIVDEKLISLQSSSYSIFDVSLEDNLLSYDQELDYERYGSWFAGATLLTNGLLLRATDLGQLDLRSPTAQLGTYTYFGSPNRLNSESLQGVGLDSEQNLLVIGNGSERELLIQRVNASGMITDTLPNTRNGIPQNDILVLDNGNIVQSFASINESDFDTVGYSIYSPTGELLSEYTNTEIFNLDRTLTRIQLEALPDNQFALVVTNIFAGSNHLFVRNEANDTTILYPNVWSDFWNPEVQAKQNDNTLLVIGENRFASGAVGLLESDLTGTVQWSVDLEPADSRFVRDFNISQHPNTGNLVVGCTYKRESAGNGLSVFLLEEQNSNYDEVVLDIPEESYSSTVAVDHRSDGTIICVGSHNSFNYNDGPATNTLSYVEMNALGEVIVENTEVVNGQILINDYVLTNSDHLIIAGRYTRGVDTDGVLFSVNTMGEITEVNTTNNSSNHFKLWPQPVATAHLNFSLENEFTGRCSFSIWNANGQRMDQVYLQKSGSIISQQMNVQALPAGHYWLAYQDETGRAISKPFIKL